MLTRKSKYGLKALLFLAREFDRGPILASEMAVSERIPEKFLQGILLELRRRGVVRSRRGLGGGYQLARDPASINFGEVLRILDGPLALTPCVSQTAYQRCDECADEQSCGIRLVMKDVRDETARILEGASLAGVNRAVDQVKGGRAGRPVAGLRGSTAAADRRKSPAVGAAALGGRKSGDGSQGGGARRRP